MYAGHGVPIITGHRVPIIIGHRVPIIIGHRQTDTDRLKSWLKG
jgi:hypothetical protein